MLTGSNPDHNDRELKVVIDNYDSEGPFEYDGDCETLDGVPFTGLVRGFHKNGVLKHEVPMLDGFPHGTRRAWHANQQLAEDCYLIRGRASGLNREWFPNGQLKRESLSRNGLSLYRKEWDEQGHLVKESVIDKSSVLYQLSLKGPDRDLVMDPSFL